MPTSMPMLDVDISKWSCKTKQIKKIQIQEIESEHYS